MLEALGTKERLGENKDVTERVSKMLALGKLGKPPISFKAEKSVVEIVAEGRK